MNFPNDYFCFSPAMTSLCTHLFKGIEYEAHLNDLYKEDVCRELYRKYPHVAQYQYSCWKNHHQRWCHQCESCLEYYMLLKISALDCQMIGMKENLIRKNRNRLVAAAAKSAESRRGEIWERIRSAPELRKDTYIRKILDEIWFRARIYHGFNGLYRQTPEWFKRSYRAKKHLFKKRSPVTRALYDSSLS